MNTLFKKTLLAACVGLTLAAGTQAQDAKPAAPAAAPDAPAATAKPADWRETYAYNVGMQALVYGFPLNKALLQRYFMVEKPAGRVSSPVNAFYHARTPGNSDDKYGSSISDDILYSVAWYDVEKEPVVLTIPHAGKHYYGVQMMEMYSDIHHYAGSRATHDKAGSYLVVGPNWKGKTPKGIAGVMQSPTPKGLMLMRIDFESRDKLEPTHALQDQTHLTPLSYWLAKKPFTATERDVLDPILPGKDPLWLFRNINRGMTENPPPAAHAPLLTAWRTIGIGPGLSDDFSTLDPAIRAGLQRAQTDGMALLTQATKSSFGTKVVNHWFYGQANWGRTAKDYDFLTRASTQSLAGFQEHHIEEVVKLRAHLDADGAALSGDGNRYVLRFAPGQVPQARAFWAVTVYDEKYDLVANPIGRYSLGSHDQATFKPDADGGYTMLLQAEAPSPDKAANWLPVPKGPFSLFLRAYSPDEALQKQTYVPPAVERVK